MIRESVKTRVVKRIKIKLTGEPVGFQSWSASQLGMCGRLWVRPKS